MKGSCHCKKVQFETEEQLEKVINCHCDDCLKLHGNFMPFVVTEWGKVKIDGEDFLKWYQYSEKSKRGFCSECGSRLFMKMLDSDRVLISAGVFDDTSGLKPVNNIFGEAEHVYYPMPEVFEK